MQYIELYAIVGKKEFSSSLQCLSSWSKNQIDVNSDRREKLLLRTSRGPIMKSRPKEMNKEGSFYTFRQRDSKSVAN